MLTALERKALLITVTAAGVLSVIAALAGPHIWAMWASPQGERERLYYSTPMIGGGDDQEPFAPAENPLVHISMPGSMTESETAEVEARLEYNIPSVGLLQGIKPPPLEYAASLTSPAFDVSPGTQAIRRKADDGLIVWKWLITPKRAGAHKLRLEFDQPVVVGRSISEAQRRGSLNASLAVDRQGASGSVIVLTALGLTTAQDALAKGLGAIVAFLGTLFGYPFIKGRLETSTAARGRSTDDAVETANQEANWAAPDADNLQDTESLQPAETSYIRVSEASSQIYDEVQGTWAAVCTKKWGLSTMANYILYTSIPMYGRDPIGRKLFEIDKDRIRGSCHFLDDGNEIRLHGGDKPEWLDVSIRRTDLHRVIEEIRANDENSGPTAGGRLARPDVRIDNVIRLMCGFSVFPHVNSERSADVTDACGRLVEWASAGAIRVFGTPESEWRSTRPADYSSMPRVRIASDYWANHRIDVIDLLQSDEPYRWGRTMMIGTRNAPDVYVNLWYDQHEIDARLGESRAETR